MRRLSIKLKNILFLENVLIKVFFFFLSLNKTCYKNLFKFFFNFISQIYLLKLLANPSVKIMRVKYSIFFIILITIEINCCVLMFNFFSNSQFKTIMEKVAAGTPLLDTH